MTEYLFPTSIEEALDILETHRGGACIVAGGTDVLPDIRAGKIHPTCLVDITLIPDLNQIQFEKGFVQVGAAVTFATLKEDPFLNQHVHALVDAARSVGALGIQTAATWAGNVVQAMPAADGAIVAVALEAEARVVDQRGVAWQPVVSLFSGPGRSTIDPTRQLITHLRFSWSGSRWGTAWKRIGRRPSLVLPILNCAVKLELEPAEARVARATIALGPVAPYPFRAHAAEAFLAGRPATEAVLGQAAQLAQKASNPRSSVMRASRAYRLDVIPTLVGDALAVALERAGQEEK